MLQYVTNFFFKRERKRRVRNGGDREGEEKDKKVRPLLHLCGGFIYLYSEV